MAGCLRYASVLTAARGEGVVVAKAVTLGAVLALGLVVAGAASPATSGQVFYLSARVHQCLITTQPPSKTEVVVPCSNAAHNFEVYAVGHGGWGHKRPSNTYELARSVCLSTYHRLTGHSLPKKGGWWGFWPDAGAETARYGDRVVCSYRTAPTLKPLGSGWHVR
jgi:hypothetical protein